MEGMDTSPHLYVFIMAGGSGERFWPLSRKETPKQLLRLFSGETLLGETAKRLEGLVPPERLFILTNAAQVEGTRKHLPWFPAAQIIGEPAKRDTAPAAALATAIARARDPDAVVVLLPADQLIKDSEASRRNLADAAQRAGQQPSLITLAIPPTFPATGFGYLQLGEELETGGTTSFARVDRFVEKPDLATAEEYLKTGKHFWNAGIFVWKASVFLDQTAALQPELAGFITEFPAGDFFKYLAEEFPGLPKKSVDYAIMEQATSVVAARTQFDWDDVGSWTSLPDHLGRDTDGNTVKGSATIHEAKNNILFSTGRTIAICGADDLVVVETPDAVLVCHRDRVQEVKKLLPGLPPDLL